MAIINKVEKKVRMDNWNIIRFQLSTYCFLKQIPLSEAELDCFTFLGQIGEAELTDFCKEVAGKRVEAGKQRKIEAMKSEPSSQTIRNMVTKAERLGIIIKEGKNRKKITIHPDLKIQTKGNIVLDFKFACVDTQEA